MNLEFHGKEVVVSVIVNHGIEIDAEHVVAEVVALGAEYDGPLILGDWLLVGRFVCAHFAFTFEGEKYADVEKFYTAKVRTKKGW